MLILWLAFPLYSAVTCPAESDSSLVPWGAMTSWPTGQVPAPGVNVTVPSGMRVLLSAAEAPATTPLSLGYVEVQENATLVLATHGAAIELHLLGITVRGELKVGTYECPVATSVVIELTGERLPLSERGIPPPPQRKGIHVTGSGAASTITHMCMHMHMRMYMYIHMNMHMYLRGVLMQ